MMTTGDMEKKLGALLLTGTLVATTIVLLGGIGYLVQNGSHLVDFNTLQHAPTMGTLSIWHSAFSLTPLGLIQLGLLILVGTQIMRVGVLFIFYLLQRDGWYSIFCGFVFVLLIYSLFS